MRLRLGNNEITHFSHQFHDHILFITVIFIDAAPFFSASNDGKKTYVFFQGFAPVAGATFPGVGVKGFQQEQQFMKWDQHKACTKNKK